MEADPWETVHDQVGELGDRLKETYRRVADERGPSEEEIRQALTTLAAVRDQVASSLSAVFHDPELRRSLKASAAALADALGGTISSARREIRDYAEEE